MTAVEFLYERLERMIPRTALYNMDKEDYFDKAKGMEKQQQDDFAIEFVEWVLNSNLILNRITVKELLEQFKNK